ncbi:uncharacterized protein LOC113359108 [Papaver somniferum]|uniref:uncharacterized protein LOC113359108 n=1 Tax=Papaver somniferum TaxID=3469 RepID=UPI000E703E53|nr:uncharacterized protein LOC113359108 [Papaver somniferum]
MGYEASRFGYVASTNEYKVVRIMYVNKNKTDREVYIYTLGSGHGWRNLGKFTFGNEEQLVKGVFVDGALHWLDYQLKKMVTFDLAEEKFCKHISPPLPPDDDFDGTYQLGVFDGEFRVYENGLFAVTKSGDVLTYRNHHINIHNLEALTSKVIVDVKEYFREVFPHKNTLISLKELGEEDAKIMESVETEETDRKQ